MSTRIAVCGAAGRMGRTIIGLARETDGVELTAAVESASSPALDRDAGELAGVPATGVVIGAELGAVMDGFDVLIDFTRPEAVLNNVRQCRSAGRRMVIGTTGLDGQQKRSVEQAAGEIAIVFAPNMSIGVNLCFKLAELAAQVVGENTDIEIIEAHHSRKEDAPSGTAVHLGEIIAGALGRDLKNCAVYAREGHTGPRPHDAIGFETIRAGDIVGDHTVMFAGAGERIEITHRASSRKTFASGALRAAQWVMQHDSGLFDMQDVLGLR